MKNLIRTLALSTVLVIPVVAMDQEEDAPLVVHAPTMQVLESEDVRISGFNHNIERGNFTLSEIDHQLIFAAAHDYRRLAGVIFAISASQRPKQDAISAAIKMANTHNHKDMTELLKSHLTPATDIG